MSNSDLRRIIDKSVSGGQTLMAALEEIRKRIVLSQYAITSLHQAPVSKDEAIQRLDNWISSVSAKPVTSNFAARFTSSSHRSPVSVVPPELLSAAVSATLRDLIAEEIAENYSSVTGISAVDRAHQLEKSEGELLELELAEEMVIRHAEARGIDVLRRIDADPRAVLCHGDILK